MNTPENRAKLYAEKLESLEKGHVTETPARKAKNSCEGPDVKGIILHTTERKKRDVASSPGREFYVMIVGDDLDNGKHVFDIKARRKMLPEEKRAYDQDLTDQKVPENSPKRKKETMVVPFGQITLSAGNVISVIFWSSVPMNGEMHFQAGTTIILKALEPQIDLKLVEEYVADPKAPKKYILNEDGTPQTTSDYGVQWNCNDIESFGLSDTRSAKLLSRQLIGKAVLPDPRLCDSKSFFVLSMTPNADLNDRKAMEKTMTYFKQIKFDTSQFGVVETRNKMGEGLKKYKIINASSIVLTQSFQGKAAEAGDFVESIFVSMFGYDSAANFFGVTSAETWEKLAPIMLSHPRGVAICEIDPVKTKEMTHNKEQNTFDGRNWITGTSGGYIAWMKSILVDWSVISEYGWPISHDCAMEIHSSWRTSPIGKKLMITQQQQQHDLNSIPIPHGDAYNLTESPWIDINDLLKDYSFFMVTGNDFSLAKEKFAKALVKKAEEIKYWDELYGKSGLLREDFTAPICCFALFAIKNQVFSNDQPTNSQKRDSSSSSSKKGVGKRQRKEE